MAGHKSAIRGVRVLAVGTLVIGLVAVACTSAPPPPTSPTGSAGPTLPAATPTSAAPSSPATGTLVTPVATTSPLSGTDPPTVSATSSAVATSSPTAPASPTPTAPSGFANVALEGGSVAATTPDDWEAYQASEVGSAAYLAAEQRAFVPVPETDESSLAAAFFVPDGSHVVLTRVSDDESQARALALALSKTLEGSLPAGSLVRTGVSFDDGPGYRLQYSAQIVTGDPRIVSSDVVFFPAAGSVWRVTLTGADPVAPAVIDAALAAARSVRSAR